MAILRAKSPEAGERLCAGDTLISGKQPTMACWLRVFALGIIGGMPNKARRWRPTGDVGLLGALEA
jgi:hypothetical protein